MHVVARLRPGTDPAAARADLARVAARLGHDHPRTNATIGTALVPLAERILGPVRPGLLVLLGAVGLMLLIACANVAGLLLARGAEREPELAVRVALGADRPRLVRQLLTESVLLGVLGGALGVVLAVWGTRALVALSPAWLPRASAIAVDGRVLAFAAVLAFGTALLFGWIPALRVARSEPAQALAGAGRATATRRRARLRSGLVVAEIALALVLLCGAGLLVRSFARLAANDLGFQTAGRASVQMFLWDRNPTLERRLQRMEEIAARFRALPGVDAVGLVSALPFHPSQIDARGELAIEGRAVPPGATEAQVHTTIASASYFAAMDIPLRAGRTFEARDRMDAPRVAIVNQALARRYFPGEDPIGKRVRFGVMAAPESREIVGVVGDVRPTTLDSEPRAEIYVPYTQSGSGSVTFVARTRGDARVLVARMREAVWQVDHQQSIYHAATVEELIAKTLLERRFHLVLLATLSLVALALAGIGVYGLISVTTSQRTHEIGVRIALGARPRDIVALVLGQGVRLLIPGVLLGTAGALALTRFMQGMLYGVRPGDPATYAQVAAILGLVAVIGALLPALRAAWIEPVRALREG
jgi:putative ABC transport system permease protein